MIANFRYIAMKNWLACRDAKKILAFFDLFFVRKSFIVSPEMHGEKIC